MRQQEYKKQNKVVLEGIEPVESREDVFIWLDKHLAGKI